MEQSLQIERRDPGLPNRPRDHRTDFERDLARLIHSAAFRRLQAKTQVLGIGEGDFHRTRLTHSMEVAQIGKGIVNNLKHNSEVQPEIITHLPDPDLIMFICLAHDLGHPPFGHGGEIALNYCMRKFGGFEGNGQTLRILARLEAHSVDHGLNLTRRSLLGILKYPLNYSIVCRKVIPAEKANLQVKASDWKPPKCYHDEEIDVVDWILKPFSEEDVRKLRRYDPPTNDKHGKPREKSLDTSIMELADDIAYGVHDLEDAIALKLINHDMWQEIKPKFNTQWGDSYGLTNIDNDLFKGDSSQRKRAIGALVHAFISGIAVAEKDFTEEILNMRIVLNPQARDVLDKLNDMVLKYVIKIPEVQTLEYRGQQIVLQLFEAISSDPMRLLKTSFASHWRNTSTEADRMRIISDYISGMTDEYATRMYERLFIPRHGTIFQRI